MFYHSLHCKYWVKFNKLRVLFVFWMTKNYTISFVIGLFIAVITTHAVIRLNDFILCFDHVDIATRWTSNSSHPRHAGRPTSKPVIQICEAECYCWSRWHHETRLGQKMFRRVMRISKLDNNARRTWEKTRTHWMWKSSTVM